VSVPAPNRSQDHGQRRIADQEGDDSARRAGRGRRAGSRHWSAACPIRHSAPTPLRLLLDQPFELADERGGIEPDGAGVRSRNSVTSIRRSPRSIRRDVGLPGQSVSVAFSFYKMVGTLVRRWPSSCRRRSRHLLRGRQLSRISVSFVPSSPPDVSCTTRVTGPDEPRHVRKDEN
jgi:hypothetical protein